jgi:hypothetical protein
MKQTPGVIFTAFDGSPFVSEKACLEYENGHWHKQLVGLTLEQVLAALDRLDTDLADAFERAARKIAAKRREQGETRKPGPKAGEGMFKPDDADALARVASSKVEPLDSKWPDVESLAQLEEPAPSRADDQPTEAYPFDDERAA